MRASGPRGRAPRRGEPGRGEDQRSGAGHSLVRDLLGSVQPVRGGEERQQLGGDGFEVGLHRTQGLIEFPAVDRKILGPEGPGAAGPVGNVGVGPGAVEPWGQFVADGLVGAEEASVKTRCTHRSRAGSEAE